MFEGLETGFHKFFHPQFLTVHHNDAVPLIRLLDIFAIGCSELAELRLFDFQVHVSEQAFRPHN